MKAVEIFDRAIEILFKEIQIFEILQGQTLNLNDFMERAFIRKLSPS